MNSIPVKSKIVSTNVAQYINGTVCTDSAIEGELREETMKLAQARMISSPDVGALLQILVSATGGHRVLEIGTFTGYTALRMAQVLAPEGKLYCCDVSEEWTAIGRRYWQRAGVDKKIDLRLAPALDTLAKLEDEVGPKKFDFAFIDADKQAYPRYYEACLRLLRKGGMLVIDNVLWDGEVAEPTGGDGIVRTLRELNLTIARDPRVKSSLLSVGDGLMVAIVN